MLNKVEMKIVKEIFEESESESKIKIRWRWFKFVKDKRKDKWKNCREKDCMDIKNKK
jgi:hypothetical protein